jgi:hypothetical protein
MTTPFAFLEPWRAVTRGGGDAVEQEFRRELAEGHVLFHRPVRALARRHDGDDVLFELVDTGECAVVHLTWSTRSERPPFPTTRTYESVSFWASTAMFRDHADVDGNG